MDARFIVIEGIDGAGTTTQARLLVESLSRDGQPAIQTFEPTDGPIGSLIRQMLNRRVVTPRADNRFEPVDADTLTLLFSADRLDHLRNTIEPALAAGKTVVCDRYDYSTRAYQGVNGDVAWIGEANKKARRPDLVLYCRLPAEVALARLENRAEISIFEKQAFLEKVIEQYETIFNGEPNVVVIDATQSVEAVHAAIRRAVQAR